MSPVSHYDHSLYAQNSGNVCNQIPLPLPNAKGLSIKLNTYDDVEEPRFDPKVHLDLKHPEYIRLLPDFKKTTFPCPRVTDHKGSQFAYSTPFQVLSEEGLKVMRKIVLRHESAGVPPEFARGCKIALRGLYYLSPFIRDFQNCAELREIFSNIVGEELIPHANFSSCPQVNLSVKGPVVNNAPVDPWHWDSLSYTGVILLNDMKDFKGGELELMKMEKKQALKELEAGRIVKGVHTDVISYEKPGRMILSQGSEVLHHVCPMQSESRRISMVMAYAPANCFQPPKTILESFRRVDRTHNLGDFEFFREKCWQGMHALKFYMKDVQYSNDGASLARHLRVVAEELNRASDVLDGTTNDMINFFDEVNNKIVDDYAGVNVKQNGVSS